MNANIDNNRLTKENFVCADVGTPKLRAMSLALLGLVAPAVSQSSSIAEQGCPQITAATPADVLELRKALSNLSNEHKKVDELVKDTTGQISTATAVTAEQQALQKLIVGDLLTIGVTSRNLSSRMTEFGSTVNLVEALPKLKSGVPLLTALFPTWYLEQSVDLQKSYGLVRGADGSLIISGQQLHDATQHYLQFGRFEGRAPSPFFDPKFYLEKNADVARAAPADPAERMKYASEHWIRTGSQEGRQGSPLFEPRYYAQSYPLLTELLGDNYNAMLSHYLLIGITEGRAPSAMMKGIVKLSGSIVKPYTGNREEHAAAMVQVMSSIGDAWGKGGECDPVDLVPAFKELFGAASACSTLSPTCEFLVMNASDSLEVVVTCGKATMREFVQAYEKMCEERAKEDAAKTQRAKEQREGEFHERDRQNAGGERYETRERGGTKIA